MIGWVGTNVSAEYIASIFSTRVSEVSCESDSLCSLHIYDFFNSERVSESMNLLRNFVGLLGRVSAHHGFCTDSTGTIQPTSLVLERPKTVRALETARPRVRLYYYSLLFLLLLWGGVRLSLFARKL